MVPNRLLTDSVQLISTVFFPLYPTGVLFNTYFILHLVIIRRIASKQQKISYTASMNNNKPKGIEPWLNAINNVIQSMLGRRLICTESL